MLATTPAGAGDAAAWVACIAGREFGQLIREPRAHIAELVADLVDRLRLQPQPFDDLFSHMSRMITQTVGSATTRNSVVVVTIGCAVAVDKVAITLNEIAHYQTPSTTR